MELNADISLALNISGVVNLVKEAGQKAMKDTVVDITNDAVRASPKKTGNNARSITFEVGPGGQITTDELSGAVYSTSGYGGFLETGTVKMAPRPYMKPALDRNFTLDKFTEKVRGNLGSG